MNNVIPAVLYQEQELCLNLWKQGLRVDGRSFNQTRDIDIQYPSSWGNCILSLGGSSVSASVRMEIKAPNVNLPRHGFIQVVLKGNLAKSTQDELTDDLLNIIKKGKVITSESLCIIQGHAVWSLRIDLFVLSHMGNIRDAVNWATFISLMHYRRPEITIVNNHTVKVHDEVDRDPQPLHLHHIPLSLYMMIPPDFIDKPTNDKDSSFSPIVDPTRAEAATSNGILYIAINAEKEVCSLRKEGGKPLDFTKIKSCIEIAQDIIPTIYEHIKESLSKDSLQRSEKKLEMFSWAKTRIGVGKI